ncbi:MAG TPA: type II toxin-antitoxin system RelE/ParE family toxin [Kofleriaceae bacterium]|jgi:plasmid stabilization system protein ParE
MPVQVDVEARAIAMLEEADRYWSRGAARENPLVDQFWALVDRLADFPELGQRRPLWWGRPPFRRCVLRCGWTVFYEYPSVAGTVKIVAVWHSARGGRPPI